MPSPTPESPSRGATGFLYALATACVWGTIPIALKLVLGPLDGATVVWYRFAFAAVFLTALLGPRGQLKLPELTRGEIVLLVVTVLTFSANNLTFMLGLKYISPTASQVLIQLAPLLVIGAGVFVFGEPFGGLQWIGTPVLAGGILLFFHTQLAELASGVSTSGMGILLISIAALCWAAFAVGQKRLLPRFGSFRLMWMVYAVGVVLMSPLAAPAHAARLTGWQSLLLFYSCLTTVLGYAMFSEALKLWEASRVGAVVAVTPLFTWTFNEVAAGLFPQFVHAEAADGWSLVGALCVAGGSALAALGRKTTGVISARPFPGPPALSAPVEEHQPVAAARNQCPTRS
ncbi:MAG: DMT family transporter [Acidobacteria bacterium]|nr:DMT family transporter [Acidobacteriota bacterium]